MQGTHEHENMVEMQRNIAAVDEDISIESMHAGSRWESYGKAGSTLLLAPLKTVEVVALSTTVEMISGNWCAWRWNDEQ